MQRKSCGWIIAGLMVLFAALLAPPAAALISVSEGDTPVQNMSWPTGSEAVANFPGRLGYMEGPPFGGGEYYFRYQSKATADFNEALQKFAAIRVPRAARSVFTAFGPEVEIVDDKPFLLVVRDWPMDEASSGGGKRVDWTFTVWIPESFYHLFNNPKGTFEATHPSFRQPVPPPRIDAFIGGDSPIAWDKVVVPPNVRVVDKRATAAPADRIGGVVRGSVFDMATHQAIAGATVCLVGDCLFRVRARGSRLFFKRIGVHRRFLAFRFEGSRASLGLTLNWLAKSPPFALRERANRVSARRVSRK